MTNVNQAIYEYLTNQRTQVLQAFQSTNTVVNSVRERLDSVNLDDVSHQFYQELITNCEQYWLEAIEPIDGILLEYDYIYRPNEEAVAYGIIFHGENSFRLQAEPYHFGYQYGFAALFEAVPGITLSVANPLSELEDFPDKYEEGVIELKEAYVLTASLALYLSLADFTQSSTFKKLPRHSPTHFFFQEHDCPSQPVYIAK